MSTRVLPVREHQRQALEVLSEPPGASLRDRALAGELREEGLIHRDPLTSTDALTLLGRRAVETGEIRRSAGVADGSPEHSTDMFTAAAQAHEEGDCIGAPMCARCRAERSTEPER